MRKFLFFFLISLLLTGCGFHLRGQTTFAPPLQRIYIKTQAPYSELTHNLRQYFQMSNIYVANSPSDASSILEIISENTSQQLVGVSGTQQTRQYNLTLSVTFAVTKPNGQVLVIPETLSETRVLPISSGQILGGSNEATALFQLMRRAIVFDIMNRLSSMEVTQKLTQTDRTS
jgi:LPS-assembly lipoprotein